MKICHLCNGHFVDDGRVFHRTCVGLAKAGYDVHLFAVGKGTKAYQSQGVTIHPWPECVRRKERFARRSHLAKMAADLKPDLFHVHEPELLGSALAWADRKPVVYDVHESYSDVLREREWIPGWSKPFVGFAWDRWERRLVRQCAGIVVVTEHIARRYRRLHTRVQVVSNYPDLSGLEDLPAVARDGVTCVFAGSLRPDRGLSQLVEALAILKGKGLRVPLKLAGTILSDEYFRSFWKQVDRLGVKDLVSYHGVLSTQEALAFQQKGSIGLIPYLPVPNTMASMANKLLECMAVGLPLVFSDFPNYQEIAGKSGAGIAVDPTKAEQIAYAIERLVRDPSLARQMGEAGMRAVRQQFNWNVERIKLLKLYQDILGGHSDLTREAVGGEQSTANRIEAESALRDKADGLDAPSENWSMNYTRCMK